MIAIFVIHRRMLSKDCLSQVKLLAYHSETQCQVGPNDIKYSQRREQLLSSKTNWTRSLQISRLPHEAGATMRKLLDLLFSHASNDSDFWNGSVSKTLWFRPLADMHNAMNS
jgi:hypothetical protein